MATPTPSPSIQITYWPEATPDHEPTDEHAIQPPVAAPPLFLDSLAGRLVSILHELDATEVELEGLLAAVFPTFRPLFPRHLSMWFHAPRTLEVWGVTGEPGAIAELALAGFTRVRPHNHPSARPLICRCPLLGPAA